MATNTRPNTPVSMVVCVADVPPHSKSTEPSIQESELIRFGITKHGLSNIVSARHVEPSGAVYKLEGGKPKYVSKQSVHQMYNIHPVTVKLDLDSKLKITFCELAEKYPLLCFNTEDGKISGQIESIVAFLDVLNEKGAGALIGPTITATTLADSGAQHDCKVPSGKQFSSKGDNDEQDSESTAAGAGLLAQVNQSVYDNMSPDALSLLEKLPEGSIEGVHYDSMAGRVLIDKETPQLEDERVSKFQAAYQSIIRKLKIVSVPVPPTAPSDAVVDIIRQYKTTYDHCVFILQELEGSMSVKIISISSRQHDQAKHLLAEDLASVVVKSEILHLSDGRKLTLKKANIVKEDVDVIVNPANSRLGHAGGVAKALNEASGGMLQVYSNSLMQKRKKEVPTGRVVATQGGGSLKCTFVLHAVGPTAAQKQADCERLLSSVVNHALKCAEDKDVASISFPAISTGIFGVDKKLVARCVVDTIERYHFTKPHPVLSDIRIVIIDDKTYAPFARYLQQKKSVPKASKQHGTASKKLHRDLNQSTSNGATQPSVFGRQNSTEERGDAAVCGSATFSGTYPHIPDKELSLKDRVKIVSLLKPLANNWLVIGNALGFDRGVLEEIGAQPGGDDTAKLGRLLYKWLSGEADKASLSVLVTALSAIEGIQDIVRSVITAYTTDQDTMAETSGKGDQDIGKIAYPNHESLSDPQKQTGATGDDQLASLMSELTVSQPPTTHGGFSRNQQGCTLSSSSTSSTFVTGTMITACAPTPSMATSVLTPQAVVSSPPPGLYYQTPTGQSTIVGYNNGQPYGYMVGGQGGYPQTAAQQPMYPQYNQAYSARVTPGGMDATNSGQQFNAPNSQGYHQASTGGLTGPGFTPQGGTGGFLGNEHYNQNITGATQPSADPAVVSWQDQWQWVDSVGTHSVPTDHSHQCIFSGNQMNYSQAVAGQGNTAGMVTTRVDQGTQHMGGLHHHGSSSGHGATSGKQSNDKEECPICLSDCIDPVKTKCGHVFCKGCLDRSLQISSSLCPTCKTPLKAVIGNQPIGGTMNVQKHRRKLPGYHDCGTIEITYHIPSGTQTQEHPNPGRMYQGATRIAYLPDNFKGREVLQLLRKAFDARLVFTVGTSVTSGQSDVVTWNDIHHKTNMNGGQQQYGYPDPTYLERVKADLAAKGIVPDESTV